MEKFVRLWGRATSADVAWVDAGGTPYAITAVPLLDGPVPCVALTFDRAALLPSLAGAAAVAFAVTDARALPGEADGVAAIGRVAVERVDALGEALLTQELRKYPPSRALADSILLRRENWWYVARAVVRLDRVDRVQEVPARRDAGRDALLVRDDGTGLRLDVAAADDWSLPAVPLRAAAPLRGDGGPVLAHGHDFSPDRERWESWGVRGQLCGDRLDVGARDGRPGLDPAPLRLLQRLRRSRAFERGCRRGIAAAEWRS
ncbi:hypothetical protein [Pseudonocardia nigra]|uniref:hypothetical protein n=1 Tax=Pseudonocardia nigra TaxID=1921578 RepID=UPI001C60247C|nr:hypothetical protein [Pseudonocardia nigra]